VGTTEAVVGRYEVLAEAPLASALRLSEDPIGTAGSTLPPIGSCGHQAGCVPTTS
jgi:hypothetical protein